MRKVKQEKSSAVDWIPPNVVKTFTVFTYIVYMENAKESHCSTEHF